MTRCVIFSVLTSPNFTSPPLPTFLFTTLAHAFVPHLSLHQLALRSPSPPASILFSLRTPFSSSTRFDQSLAMADIEKQPKVKAGMAEDDNKGGLALPTGWMYRRLSIGSHKLPWYASPEVQITLVALVCFLCPGKRPPPHSCLPSSPTDLSLGMFNALGGLGGGGQINPKAANDANCALYSTFAVVGFFAGTIVNRLGVKVSIALSGLGYSLYISAFLCYNYTGNYGYTVFAGFVLGCCAGVLWSAQGVIILSYPPEKSKGLAIAWFWIIFNLGGVIGGLVPLAQNIHANGNVVVTNGTYISFLILTLCGAFLALCLVNGNKVIRRDHSKVILMENPTWKTELFGLWETIQTDPYIALLFPMFFVSNWFYTYQFNDVNLAQFTTRARALNSVLYWCAQIFGAGIFGVLLDLNRFRRTTRAKAAWVALFVLTMVVWGGGYHFQKGYTRADVSKGADTPNDPSDDYAKMDWTSEGYAGPMILFVVYGMYDAIWQVTVYWYVFPFCD